MKAFTPLSRWLTDAPTNTVACGQPGPVDAAQLRQQVANWQQALGDCEGQRWVLFHSDPLEFVAMLLAVWQQGGVACIPGDNCPATVERLRADAHGFLGEFDCVETLSAAQSSAELPDWQVLDPNREVLEIYTSGSTGEPEAIGKRLFQLEREIAVLHELWVAPSDAVVLASVSHQHIYGLLFRVLWPLCAGIPFERRNSLYPEDLLQQAQAYAQVVLVSSPAQLSRLNETLDWQPLRQRLAQLFSSGAPLAREHSLQAAELLGQPAHEVYGSSETGGIAWRAQQAEQADALWQPLPGIRLEASAEQTLMLWSPFLEDDAVWLQPDRVEFDDQGCFRLLGRSDRIVKVEGKRFSLTRLEALLKESPLVEAARSLMLRRQRDEIAVVLQPAVAGQRLLNTEGRKAFLQALRTLLSTHFEAVLLPRRWRLVEQMPFNAQGKLTQATLTALFEQPEPPVAPRQPLVLQQHIEGLEAELQLHIPAALLYFQGHFTDAPVLPGIVQVHWAEHFGRQLLPVHGRFERMEVIKFQQLILPEDELTLALRYDDARHKLIFSYTSERGSHASGRICFGGQDV